MGSYLSRSESMSSQSIVDTIVESCSISYKISNRCKEYLIKNGESMIQVCLISSIPFEKIEEYDFKSKNLTLYSDMTCRGKHACCVCGKGSDILKAIDTIEWIKEIQLIPMVHV